MDSTDSGRGLVAGSCNHSNETLASIKGEGILDQLRTTISFSRSLCSTDLVT